MAGNWSIIRSKIEVKYTYADYLTWSDDERWELIDGIPYNMTPAPSRSHQEVLNAINYAF